MARVARVVRYGAGTEWVWCGYGVGTQQVLSGYGAGTHHLITIIQY